MHWLSAVHPDKTSQELQCQCVLNLCHTLIVCLHDEQDFGGRSGFWKLTYHDENLRILYTNQGNVFVLQRVE